MSARNSFFTWKDTNGVIENPHYMLPCFSFCKACGMWLIKECMQDAACQRMHARCDLSKNCVERQFMQSLSLHGRDINTVCITNIMEID